MMGFIYAAGRLLGNPIGLLIIGNIAVIGGGFGLWHVAKSSGYNEGVAAQIEAQAAADQEQGDAIRERVKDAIQQMGVDVSDTDVDSILRELAGQ